MTKSMKERLHNYCMHEMKNVIKHGHNPNETCARCYGAVMFVLNECGWDEEVAKMWDDEIHPKFRELGAI